MLIETKRLILRPVSVDDTHDIAQVVFSDPNVVGMLAHNTKDPSVAHEEAKRWTSVMGIDGGGSIWKDGGMGLFAVIPKGDDDKLAGVAGFYMECNEDQCWDGEYFYALGTEWHGQGLMSEAADAFGEKLKSMPNLGMVYAAYWDMINEASGKLLIRTGLEPRGRMSIIKEYSVEKCLGMFDYDLWCLEEAKSESDRQKALIQAARRAGAFVAEGVIDKNHALQQLANRCGSEALSPAALSIFEKAIASPGMAYLEIRGSDNLMPLANRLG